MIDQANANEIRRLREDFELQASKYPDLALTRYYIEEGVAPPKLDFKTPDHAIALWQYVGTFTKDSVKTFPWAQRAAHGGLPGAMLSAFAVVHGPETDLFRRMANRAGSLLSGQIDLEVGGNLQRQFSVPPALGRGVFVCNANPMARWLNLLLYCVAKFQSNRLEHITLPIDPFAASLAVFDHILVEASTENVASTKTNVKSKDMNVPVSNSVASPSTFSRQAVSTSSDDVTYGIVTALEKEYVAMKSMLRSPIEHVTQRGRVYWRGQIPAKGGGAHSIALALADQGTAVATHRATLLIEDFPDVEAVLMVGIAGGVPHVAKPDRHVRLGDVVASGEQGIIAYDFVKEHADRLEPRHPPRPPHAGLYQACRRLVASALEGGPRWLDYISLAAHLPNSVRPHVDTDWLADTIDATRRVEHPRDVDREQHPGAPRVFIGTIACANRLLKNPAHRDQIRDDFNVLAVEMEGFGIAEATWNQGIGYLIIRGICDYCDANKGNTWQGYAAIAAAAYARAVLEETPASTRSETGSTSPLGNAIGAMPEPTETESSHLPLKSIFGTTVHVDDEDMATDIYVLEPWGSSERRAANSFRLWVESPALGLPFIGIAQEDGFLAGLRNQFWEDFGNTWEARVVDRNATGISVEHRPENLHYHRIWQYRAQGLMAMAATIRSLYALGAYSAADIALDVARFVEMARQRIGVAPATITLEWNPTGLRLQLGLSDTRARTSLQGVTHILRDVAVGSAETRAVVGPSTIHDSIAIAAELMTPLIQHHHGARVDESALSTSIRGLDSAARAAQKR